MVEKPNQSQTQWLTETGYPYGIVRVCVSTVRTVSLLRSVKIWSPTFEQSNLAKASPMYFRRLHHYRSISPVLWNIIYCAVVPYPYTTSPW